MEQQPIKLFKTKYSDKSFVVTGDIQTHANELGRLGGKFNPSLRGGAGWIFPSFRETSVAEYINTGTITRAPSQPKGRTEPSGNVQLRQVFEDLQGAFSDGNDYSGEDVISAINEIKTKYLGTTRLVFVEEPEFVQIIPSRKRLAKKL